MSLLPPQLQSIVTANNGVYRTLPTATSIRIITLHPGKADDDLNCNLTVVDLRDVHAFHALSYCWGSGGAVEHVTCNARQVKVKRNLYLALKQLRLESKTRYMWIDALCINQDSIEERNQQVSLIRYIYHKAARVIVWLGEDDSTTALALESMRRIFYSCCLKLYGDATYEQWCLWLQNEKQLYTALDAVINDIAAPDWPDEVVTCLAALARLFQREWFFRVWVIPEVQGCPDIWVKIGQSTIQWGVLTLSALWILIHSGTVPYSRIFRKLTAFIHVDFMRSKYPAVSDKNPFLSILNNTRGFNCSIDTDRVFALLHHLISSRTKNVRHPFEPIIGAQATHLGIKADYSTTLLDVYRQIVLRSIYEGRDLEIFNYLEQDGIVRTGYPTWMPLWHISRNSWYLSQSPNFLYCASKEVSTELVKSPTRGLLELEGVSVGQITAVNANVVLAADNFPGDTDLRFGTSEQEMLDISRLIVCDIWQSEDSESRNPVRRAGSPFSMHFEDFCAFVLSATEGSLDLTFIPLEYRVCDVCRTKLTGSQATKLNVPIQSLRCDICENGSFDICDSCHQVGKTCLGNGYHTLTARPVVGLICQLDHQAYSILNSKRGDGNWKRFEQATGHACSNKTFIRLCGGQFGLAPNAVRPGDLVVVLFGGRVPLILRSQSQHYTIVGQCYVRGIMDGEIIDDWKARMLQTEKFLLA